MRLRHLSALAVFLWAIPAGAAPWKDCVSGATLVSASLRRPFFGGVSVACFTPTDTDSGDSPILNVGGCESFDVYFDDNTASATAGAGALEVNVRSCVANTASTNHCFKILTDTDGGGLDDVTLNGVETTGRAAIYDASAVWIYMDEGAAPPGAGETPRVMVICR